MSETETLDQEAETRTAMDGQIEMTIDDSPLWHACEKLARAKAARTAAMAKFDEAEEEWIEAMRELNIGQVNHKGDKIEYVKGRTTKDHSRFKK